MPAESKAQLGFMGAALGRDEAGERKAGDPSATVAREYLRGVKKKDLPERVSKRRESEKRKGGR